MAWEVVFHRRANRAQRRLPTRVRNALLALVADIQRNGPVRGNWPNYGKLSDIRHHCHLKKGRPTYVAVWEEAGMDDKSEATIRLVEVIYVGTHENAPY